MTMNIRYIRSISILALATLLGLAVRGQTQAPAAPKTPLQMLQAMKTQNQALLEKQTALMTKLDEIKEQAAQIKFLSKRG
jgi:hypothetical protein